MTPEQEHDFYANPEHHATAGPAVRMRAGKPISPHVEVVDREYLVALQTRLFDAESALAELVRLKDGPRDDAYRRDKEIAWQRARAVLEQIPTSYGVILPKLT